MIHIFFVSGMFGSMLEMCLLSHTDLDGTRPAKWRDDGSAHTFKKQFHLTSDAHFIPIPDTVSITTPIYPFKEYKLDQILNKYQTLRSSYSEDKKLLVYAPSRDWAERNMIFQYYKICVGLGHTLEIFWGKDNLTNIQQWNKDYTHWSQMATWEYREWLSLFYPVWIQQWVDSPKQVTDDFLLVTNQSIIEDTINTLEKIIDFCDLKLLKSLDGFVDQFISKQQYILDEYETIKKISSATIACEKFTWKQLSIVGEAILQNHFRDLGYEWACDGLDVLPTNSKDFQNLIYQPTGNLHA